MILTIIQDSQGFTENRLFVDHAEMIEETFSPEKRILNAVNFRIGGKTYSERKENARLLALEIQCSNIGGLSYSEESDIYFFLLDTGKKYGLLKEFYSNGVL